MSDAPFEAGDSVARNLADIRDRIERAARRARREPSEIRLVAVSKTFPAEAVVAAIEAGQRDFGENKVQEGLQKMAAVRAQSDVPVTWHLIGHLQSNKARKAAAGFHTIHSVDRLDLLLQLDRAAADAGVSPEILVQVDLAKEATKHGAELDELRHLIDATQQCRCVRLTGLMLLPPFHEDPEETRPYFRELAALRATLVGEGYPAAQLGNLSMGMSHDFEVAIEEGATMVRVGTAIFGRRPSSNLGNSLKTDDKPG